MKKRLTLLALAALPGLAVAQTAGNYYPPAGNYGYSVPGGSYAPPAQRYVPPAAYGQADGYQPRPYTGQPGYAPPGMQSQGGYAPYGYGQGRYQQPPAQQLRPEPPPPPAGSPEALLRQGVGLLLQYLQSNPGGDQAARRFVEDRLAPYFDFAYMTKWAAGPHYRRLDAEQRSQLQAQLQDNFFAALARNLAGYGHATPQVEFLPARAGRYDGEVEVTAQIWQPQMRTPTAIAFRFYESDDGWKIFDVSANGNSALVFYRQMFAQLIRARGLRR